MKQSFLFVDKKSALNVLVAFSEDGLFVLK